MTKMKEKIMEIMGESYDDALFERAVTHSSKGTCNNERFEFLGNAILNMHLANIVYALESELEPKEMTLICNNARSNENLNEIGLKNGLGDQIITGPSTKGKVEDDMVSTAFEAIIGMLFQKGGFDLSSNFIDEFIPINESTLIEYKKKDPISRLKEYGENNNIEIIILEDSNEIDGKINHSIRIELFDLKSEGQGNTKVRARKSASKGMLIKLEESGRI